jgi:hypothetical protein
MRFFFARSSVPSDRADRSRATRRQPPSLGRASMQACLGRSLPELAQAALKPGRTTWLIARAITLRGF